jgi:HPt (histidine-containing phosphotransfer) domain-containing protein
VQRQIAEIQMAVRQRDPQALAAAVHSLKSASFSVGAGRVGQLCAQLEAQARQPAPQISPELCAALEQCVAELLPELEQLLA